MTNYFRRDSATIAVFMTASLAVSFSAMGQDLEPRTYANTPVGLNFLIAGYGYTGGGVATDPALPIENTQIELHSGVLAYVRAINVFGKSAKFDMALPYASLQGTATVVGQERDREVSGLIDPRFHFSINFFGAPALSLEEFAKYEQDTIVGANIEVTAPGGQYDAGKLVNLGTNRWSIKPELGVSKRMGPVTLELASGVRIYTDNDEFFGGKLRSQDPVYSVQGHLIYHITHGIWVAADATFYTGGQSRVDGDKNDDSLENTRAGATLALPVNKANSIKLYYSTAISGRRGSDFDTTGIAWQYRFGGGL
ncbi:transporter [Methylomonas sp. MO1]|uniref:transporter n=1 Tax=Methylomonas sp. MO1 TaxID=3073619 RepID=UPI0028A48E3D|nr:transporter [Methylomonas sp. MO1]MDT4290357.1 transporter [Methylomonas sp. MO1]